MTNDPSAGTGSGAIERDRLTILIYGVAVAFGFSVAAMGPAMPLMREDLGIDRTVGGLHFTALAIGAITAGLLVERSVRARGRRDVFWRGVAGAALGLLLIGGGWTPALTLLGALVVGISGASALMMSQATLFDHHPDQRAVALTEVNIAMSLGSVLPALVIGALVAIGLGWRPALLMPVALLMVLAATRRRERFPVSRQTLARGEARRLPGPYWLYWAAFIPSVGAEWSIGAWGAGYLVDIAETSEAAAALLMTSFFGAMVIGRIIGGRVARNVAAFPLLIGTTAVALTGFLLFWASSSVSPVVVGLLIAGLGISMQYPMLLTLATETASELVDTATARISIAAGGAVLVAPLTLGYVADQAGIRTAFGIVPALLVFVAGFALMGRRASAA
ncbi:MAG: MFS transporter [Acidimicrobiia bacterium]|nr:MFS transporter [Acidimicrobiia bacterium]